MAMDNLTIVKELDSRYAVVLGFCTKGDLDTVYDNETEAREANGGNAPSVGFVIVDRTISAWADFAELAFSCIEDALRCYQEHMASPGAKPDLLCMPLDDELALTLIERDPSNSTMYAFGFYDLKAQQPLTSIPNFSTCNEALSYYEQTLKDWEDGEVEDDEEFAITDFSGDYAFLNNGFDQDDNPIHIFGWDFRTAEGAFQSQKCPEQAASFMNCTSREAKRMGAKVPLRKDWDSVRDIVMYEVLQAKFAQSADLAQMLLGTGGAKIEPHNTRHDNHWGSCQCAECAEKEKENRLGAILMRIRETLKQ